MMTFFFSVHKCSFRIILAQESLEGMCTEYNQLKDSMIAPGPGAL